MKDNRFLYTAMRSGLLQCHSCRKLHRDTGAKQQRCGCCDDVLHYRSHDSIARTWALCLSAAIFMVLANIYPVMTVDYLGKGNPDTIISGVIALAGAGMYPIAAVVFIASIAVPLLKLTAMFWLLLMIKMDWKMDKRQCAKMFRMVKFIGRWSMLDLFVIAILVTLVHLQGIMTITGGAGATYFSTVVVLTMLAAHAFDPRLIWDLEQEKSK